MPPMWTDRAQLTFKWSCADESIACLAATLCGCISLVDEMFLLQKARWNFSNLVKRRGHVRTQELSLRTRTHPNIIISVYADTGANSDVGSRQKAVTQPWQQK